MFNFKLDQDAAAMCERKRHFGDTFCALVYFNTLLESNVDMLLILLCMSDSF